jgi:hypothetical protein
MDGVDEIEITDRTGIPHPITLSSLLLISFIAIQWQSGHE